MSTEQIRNTIETIYKVQMAALRVIEANEAMLQAEVDRRGVEYNFRGGDGSEENNRRYFALADAYYKKEAQVKRAVNGFFRAVGLEGQKWDTGFAAILAYNKYIDEHTGWYSHSPIPQFSLYECKARKYAF